MKTNGNSSEKKGPCGTFLSIFKNITNIVSATLTSEISHWIFPDILRYFPSAQKFSLPNQNTCRPMEIYSHSR